MLSLLFFIVLGPVPILFSVWLSNSVVGFLNINDSFIVHYFFDESSTIQSLGAKFYYYFPLKLIFYGNS